MHVYKKRKKIAKNKPPIFVGKNSSSCMFLLSNSRWNSQARMGESRMCFLFY